MMIAIPVRRESIFPLSFIGAADGTEEQEQSASQLPLTPQLILLVLEAAAEAGWGRQGNLFRRSSMSLCLSVCVSISD